MKSEDVGYQCLNIVITRAADGGVVCYGCDIVGAVGDMLASTSGWRTPKLAFDAAFAQVGFDAAFAGFEG